MNNRAYVCGVGRDKFWYGERINDRVLSILVILNR